MPRLLSTALCLVLLAATAGMLAVTHRARSELVPLYDPRADALFSPDCNCDTGVAKIDFQLRESAHLSVWVEHGGRRASTIVPGRAYSPGRVALEFTGISADGITLPDGRYTPVVRIGHLTVRLPNTIVLDTRPPRVEVRHRIYTHISPDGDGHGDRFSIHYAVDKPSRGILYADGRRVASTPRLARSGTLAWNGKIDGRVVRPGNHVLEISAQDAAGNRAKPYPFAVVTVRYVVLGRSRVLVRPRGHFAVLVLADAPRVEWVFARAHGETGPGTVRFRAPAKRGVYRLYVTVGEHAAKALVVVG
jgi:hypothetical protein